MSLMIHPHRPSTALPVMSSARAFNDRKFSRLRRIFDLITPGGLRSRRQGRYA